MTKQTAYLQYRASDELDSRVAGFIREMEKPAKRAVEVDPGTVIRIMELFVEESVDVLALEAAEAVGLSPAAKRIVHGLAALARTTGGLMVSRVVKGFSPEQYRRVAAYMKSLRIVSVENGKEVGDISFPIQAALAEQGWATGRLAIETGGNDPRLLPEGLQFLHAMSDVAMFWVFEEPVRQLGLKGLTATMVGGAVRSVKKSSLVAIDRVLPHISPHQLALASEYYAALLQTGPYRPEFGEVTKPPFFAKKSA